MAGFHDRRRTRRVAMPKPIPARACATMEVQVLDLSFEGGRIAHLGQLRPGYRYALEFPAILGSLSLPAQVVRSHVVGVQKGPTGERHLRYESGLAFVNSLPGKEAALTRILGELTLEENLQRALT